MDYVDYYKTLGVERGAEKDEISKAYKRLARKYHPDLNKAANAEAKFKEINEAYEVLKDPDKRQRYDALGNNWKHGAPFDSSGFGFGGGGRGAGPHVHVTDFGAGPGGFSDFFNGVFGGFGGGRGRGRGGVGGSINIEELFGQQPQQRRGSDVESRITVSLDDIYQSRKLSVEISGHVGRKRYGVTIPPGTRHGDKIRLAGQGMPGRGGVKGDLYLEVAVQPHDRFGVEGDNLAVEIPVQVWDAALGTRLPVPTLDGVVQMTLPAGVSSGQRLRLKGKGLPRRDGSRGDLYAEVRLVMPKSMSPEQKQLFMRLRSVSAADS